MNAGDRKETRSPREERLSFIKALLPRLPPPPTPAAPPPRPPPLHTMPLPAMPPANKRVPRTLQSPVMKPAGSGTTVLRLSLVVVASLCAEMAVWPEGPVEIRQRHQVPSRAVPKVRTAPAATTSWRHTHPDTFIRKRPVVKRHM